MGGHTSLVSLSSCSLSSCSFLSPKVFLTVFESSFPLLPLESSTCVLFLNVGYFHLVPTPLNRVNSHLFSSFWKLSLLGSLLGIQQPSSGSWEPLLFPVVAFTTH